MKNVRLLPGVMGGVCFDGGGWGAWRALGGQRVLCGQG